jgi:hypothetical protein
MLFSLLSAVTVTAGAFEIRKGQWQVLTEMRNPMSSPQFSTSTECITEGSFDPAQAMMQGGQCTITDRQDAADSITWKFRCGGDGMPESTGAGRFVSHGKTASGEMQMSMVLNGQTMTITNSWKGQHLADECE